MGGIIQGFLAGGAKGMADAGKMLLGDKLAREREEARDLRERALRTDLQESRQEFLTGERESEQEFTAGRDTKKYAHESAEAATERDWKSIENELDRWSAEGVAETKAGAAGGGATTNMKDAAELMRQGYPQDIANAIAHGGFIKHTDVEGNQVVVMPKANGKMVEVGKIVTDSRGNTTWVSSNPNAPKAKGPLSKEELKGTADEMNTEPGGGMWGGKSTRASDFVPWNEYGTGDDEVRAAAEKKRGLANQAATPQAAPAQGGRPDWAKEGNRVKGKDGKIYVIKNGKPVLETQ